MLFNMVVDNDIHSKIQMLIGIFIFLSVKW